MLKKAQFVTSMAQYRPAGMLKPFPQIALAGQIQCGEIVFDQPLGQPYQARQDIF